MIYVFPAVFQAADEGYNVRFPDLDGMFTSGDSLEEAVELAQEMLPAVLCVTLVTCLVFGVSGCATQALIRRERLRGGNGK